MTQARSNQISLDSTPYYHRINRCVRRAFLCGDDHTTGVNYEHRKQWVVDKLTELDSVFTIDVCAYAVMSNHLVLHINAEQAAALSDEEVAERWMLLFKGHLLVSRFVKDQCESDAERVRARELIEVWRERLMDISWFMRCLNEHIARKANEEDACKGRFWEGRFKSQALLDEKAVLACMVYVDLNPIRAKLAETPEQSDFTSIQQRINEVSEGQRRRLDENEKPVQAEEDREVIQCPSLLRFSGGFQDAAGIPYHRLADYIELVDWSGRVVVPGKRGTIAERFPVILMRLGFDEADWSGAVNGFNRGFHDFIGGADSLQRVCDNSSRSWIRGSRACRQVFDRARVNEAA